MQLHYAAAALLSLALLLLPSTTNAQYITRILAKYPEFSTFNHYLTDTLLAPEINRRKTITVCAVDNAAMDSLLSKQLTSGAIKNVLSLHVLLDYFDAKKLHQITNGTALAATIFQSSGTAPGSSGFVQITNLKGGKVGLSPQDDANTTAATFVKSVEAAPYNLSVIQISAVFPSPAAEAPAPAPTEVNLTAALSARGCKSFAGALAATAAEETFKSNVESGLSVFCPGDGALKSFMPKFNNLTADGKQSLLEYHAMPVYESLSGLRSSNGAANTLATDGAKRFSLTVQNDGNDVTIKTPIVTAKIVSTVFDKEPLSIFQLDKVLLPSELFKSNLAPTPAPSPAPEEANHAKAPKASSRDYSPPAPAGPADSPADGPDGDEADQHSNGGAPRFVGFGVIFSLWFALLQL
ncbi:fasciclin-like arabinogalactan protein 1 [Salvia divinorum]|uniref:Fasciclin-like arabinogalactan protein 1 n=1 Tax=Salvia divinorum TaxID=28513 RepID=A0ABD1I2P8_SALDI